MRARAGASSGTGPAAVCSALHAARMTSGAPFAKATTPLAARVQRRHALRLGRERDLVHAGQRGVAAPSCAARPWRLPRPARPRSGRPDRPRNRLRGVAHQVRVGGEGARGEQVAHRLRPARRWCAAPRRGAASAAELAVRCVTSSGDVDELAGHVQATNGHLVARQRAGLVGADHRRAAERLHRGEPPHQGAAPHQALHAQCQRDRDDRRQRLRHHGDRERDAEHQHLDERLAAHQAERDDESPRPAIAARASWRPSLSRFTCSGVRPTSTSSSICAMRPNSVRGPVADDHGQAAPVRHGRSRQTPCCVGRRPERRRHRACRRASGSASIRR